ncbi:MAG: hypothetical protein K1X94_22775, partial [Sandaracinaceae bacterium]|nr:hypothetical protein [Sandaracinaceae bacterium]
PSLERGRRQPIAVALALGVLVLVASALGWWWQQGQAGAAPATTPVAADVTLPPVEPPPVAPVGASPAVDTTQPAQPELPAPPQTTASPEPEGHGEDGARRSSTRRTARPESLTVTAEPAPEVTTTVEPADPEPRVDPPATTQTQPRAGHLDLDDL